MEAVIRVFNRHGNRNNKNKARLKFVLRERGFEWLRDAIEEEYRDILSNGGIPMPQDVPEGFGGFQPQPPPLGTGELLPVFEAVSPDFREWRETNTRPQKQPGYSIVTVKIPQGNLTGDQMRGLAELVRAGRRRLAALHNESERRARLRAGGRVEARLWRAWRAGAGTRRARTKSAT